MRRRFSCICARARVHMLTGTSAFEQTGAVHGGVEEDPGPQRTRGGCLLPHGQSAEDRVIVGAETEMRADALNDTLRYDKPLFGDDF